MSDGPLSISAVAARLRRHLLAAQPNGPYYLGGWCRWGIVAYELARQLTEAGHEVGLLALLDADRPGAGGMRRRMAELLRRRVGIRPDDASFSQRVEQATRSYVAAPYCGNVLLMQPTTRHGDSGWNAVLKGRITVREIAGDHETMVRGNAALALAAALDAALSSVQPPLAAGRGHLPASVLAAQPA